MENRTAITLAILSAFFFIVQAAAVAGRCYHRIQANKYAAKDLKVGAVGWPFDDYFVFTAYLFGTANWVLLIFAGFEGLGTVSIVEDDDLVQRASVPCDPDVRSHFELSGEELVCLAPDQAHGGAFDDDKAVDSALRSYDRAWVVCALVVIVPCWPGRSSMCLADSYRWIFLTIIDVVTELAIIGWPLFALRDIQFRASSQRWKLTAVIIIGRGSVVPLSISFCVVMLRSTGQPFLGPQILDALHRQQGLLFASLFTSALVPVFNLFQITKIEIFDSNVELNITKTVEVRMDADDKKNKVGSSAASISPSQAGTRELLDRQVYKRPS